MGSKLSTTYHSLRTKPVIKSLQASRHATTQLHLTGTSLRTRIRNRLYGDCVTSLHLYGSSSRNEARDDRDVDLLLVLEDGVDRYEENWNLSDLVLEVLKRYGLFVGFVVLSKDEFQSVDSPLLVNNEAISL